MTHIVVPPLELDWARYSRADLELLSTLVLSPAHPRAPAAVLVGRLQRVLRRLGAGASVTGSLDADTLEALQSAAHNGTTVRVTGPLGRGPKGKEHTALETLVLIAFDAGWSSARALGGKGDGGKEHIEGRTLTLALLAQLCDHLDPGDLALPASCLGTSAEVSVPPPDPYGVKR